MPLQPSYLLLPWELPSSHREIKRIKLMFDISFEILGFEILFRKAIFNKVCKFVLNIQFNIPL